MVMKSPFSDKAITGNKYRQTLAAQDFPDCDRLSQTNPAHKKTPRSLGNLGVR
ncbi:hypothetical protein OF001_U10341 [Pseudomonas sp. OF001]|nr:hypothetical protein OF001_U10341 [Pseudomonas sp. OF001]